MPTPRRLNPIEALFHRLHRDLGGMGTGGGALRLRGCPPAEQVAAALRAIQRSRAALLAVIRERKSDGDWFEFPAEPPPLDFVHEVTADEHAWQAAAMRMATTPFDWARGPLFRARLIHSADGTWSDLIVLHHHAILDGRSLMGLLREVVRRLGVPHELERIDPPGEWPGELRIARQRMRLRQALAQLRTAWTMRALELRNLVATFDAEPGAEPLLVRRELSADATDALLAACKRHGVSAGNALLANLLATTAEVFSSGEMALPYQVPVDLRPRLQPPASGDNWASLADTFRFNEYAHPGCDVWSLAHLCRRRLDDFLASNNTYWRFRVAGRINPDRLVRNIHRLRDTLVCNNLGRLDAELEHAPYPMLAFSGVTHAEALKMRLTLTTATANGRLSLTVHTPLFTRATLDRFLDRYVDRFPGRTAEPRTQDSAAA
jgi:hypothetical protein